MTDWPALIARLHAKRSYTLLAAELDVRRESLWRWAKGKGKPRADIAVALVKLDRELSDLGANA